MHHNKGGKKLGRNGTHRRALMRNLATELFRHERIETTLGKAKALRPVAEKLITLAKRGDFARASSCWSPDSRPGNSQEAVRRPWCAIPGPTRWLPAYPEARQPYR